MAVWQGPPEMLMVPDEPGEPDSSSEERKGSNAGGRNLQLAQPLIWWRFLFHLCAERTA